jgi:hypothetical protein
MKKITSKSTLFAIGGITLVTLLSIASCSKSSSNATTPPITPLGGFVSSDSVEPGSLIAYWPFEGNTNELVSGLASTSSGITFTTGIRGQASQGSVGSSIQVPLAANSAFASLASYSVSVWYNDPVQVTSPNHGLFLMYGASDWNLLELEFERDSTSTADSVKVHAGFLNPGGVNYKGIVPEALLDTAVNLWVHLVMTYDGGSSTYTLYQDGVPVAAETAWSNGLYASTPAKIWTDGTATTPMGPISYATEVPTGLTIGAFGPGITQGNSWAGSFPGKMDELRVFKIALSAQDVAGLYLNGRAGR